MDFYEIMLQQKLAGGGGGGGADILFVNLTDTEAGQVFDKTWQEVFDAMDANIPVIVKYTVKEIEDNYFYISTRMVDNVMLQEGDYNVTVTSTVEEVFTTNSANGYPSITW